MVGMNISIVFQEHLIEILLSIILSFNVGAYWFLWSRIEENKERIQEVKGQIQNNSEIISKLLNRFFGMEEDETDQGHIVESEERFDTIDENLDKLFCLVEEVKEQQDEMQKSQTTEHRYVYSQLRQIISELDDVDDIDVSEEDLIIDDKSKFISEHLS